MVRYYLCFALFIFAMNPLAGKDVLEFIPQVITDEFNPSVTEEYRQNAQPARGGELRIMTPAQFARLNALFVQTQNDAVIVNHLSDALVARDPATLEYYPELAWRWDTADLVKTKDGEVQSGRIIKETETEIHFVPDAKMIHLCRSAISEHSNNSVRLNGNRGEITGNVSASDTKVTIDQGLGDSAEALIIKKDQLDQYQEDFGEVKQSFPFIKRDSEITFYVRDGVKWHDGEPFSAEDVAFSFETLMNPHVDAQRLRASYAVVEECNLIDQQTVRFVLKHPYFKSLELLAGVTGNRYIIPKHIFNPESFGGDEKAFAEAINQHPYNENPIYTGPYRLKERSSDRLVIERNPAYWKNEIEEGLLPRWNPGQPYLDEISWILYKENAAALKDLLNDKLDLIEQVEPAVWNQSQTQTAEFLEDIVRLEDFAFAYTYIGWNLQNPIFEDQRLREALSLMIPREEIAENVHFGAAVPVSGPFYLNGPQYDRSIEPDPYDPRRAKRLLTRAGWLDRDGDGILEKKIGDDYVPLEFTYSIHNARDYHQKIADIIKEKIEEAGAKVTIRKTEWTQFADVVREKNFDAVRYAWGQQIEIDPFNVWHSSQIANKGDNFISYRNDRVDEICVAIRRESDPIKRWELARELHRIVHEEQAQCFMFGFKDYSFIDRGLRGVRYYPSSYNYNYSEWWWADQ